MASPNTKTISVTMWEGQAQLIADAAAKRGVSVSEFIRAHTVPAAASALGVKQPEFPPFDPPHFRRGAISIAAESLGLTAEQFKQKMAEKAAEAMLNEAQKAVEKSGGAPMVVRRRRRTAGSP